MLTPKPTGSENQPTAALVRFIHYSTTVQAQVSSGTVPVIPLVSGTKMAVEPGDGIAKWLGVSESDALGSSFIHVSLAASADSRPSHDTACCACCAERCAGLQAGRRIVAVLKRRVSL